MVFDSSVIVLAVLALVAIGATVVTVLRDGYGRVLDHDDPRRAALQRYAEPTRR